MRGRPKEARSEFRRTRLTWLLAGAALALVMQSGTAYLLNRTAIVDHALTFLLVRDTPAKADAIVVLGAGVVGACLPNQSGMLRTLLAARMLTDGRAPLVVFTGGSGTPCPVAVAMAQFAREIGVPDSRMYLETASRSTRENGEKSAPLLRSLGVRRVLLVTDRLHMRRAEGTFTALGFEVERTSVPVYRSYVNNTAMLGAGVRELVALGYYRIRGWIGPGPASARSDEVESQTTVARGEWTNPSGPVVILGASYAAGWTLRDVGGTPVVNRGVEGDQSFQMLERLDRDVLAARPRAVILWGVINDFFRAGSGDLDGAVDRARSNYQQMIDIARRSGVEPILATEVTIRPPESWREMFSSLLIALRGRETYQERINRHVLAANRSLVELANERRVLMLDFHRMLSAPGSDLRRREFTQDDGSHITADGYAVLTAVVRPVLERHLSGAEPR